ncbi:hypothetical protein BU25DRAFT_461211 [Macroventuria anomochaeta]|uniref:Uncharacterized protein n=1 Tax=Macroventuria anomochaeta TaxID=301207 RepID=A0ACB6RRB7_9PLEO|nr:uncharacterized protein BU25DRAFT_461211 [Macroventuria anomochaeta]KAF2624348.1 hypothetical protein BU25DRAFT_461211 [Macroventuria anomochaeta]
MSTFPPQYQYQSQQFLYEQPFELAQNVARRSKTPTDSLINHTGLSPGGHSPGPLITTPPPLSRNPSQQPVPLQEQLPEQSFWDNGSFSNSPTSVRTPDNDSFEVEMLDSDIGRFYQDTNIMSTQSSHNNVPAVDSTMFFSDQALQEAFNTTVAANAQQYQQHFNMNAQQQYGMMATQPHNTFFGGNYTTAQPQQSTQPQQHEPWSGQGPSRFAMIPRSGHVMFDPISDPTLYTEFLNNDVNFWTANYTDPNSLLSPSEPVVPPQDMMFSFNPQHRGSQGSYGQSPVEIRFNGLPSSDQPTFVNYDANSTLITDNYITPNQFPPTSPTSSVGQYPQSFYQPTLSPQVSAPSPGSSEGKFSNQHSDFEMLDTIPAQHSNNAFFPAQSSTRGSASPAQPVPEISFDASPEPEQSRRESTSKSMNKSGGRALGTHLDPRVAKSAHDMRKIVACWHCVLQRDKCGPGETCERCLKRSQRPNADCGLGCSRIKLVDLATAFLPHLVTQMHEDSFLTQFVSQHIHQWGNVELTVMMTCGQDKMPRIPVKVYEFVPKGDTLLKQLQYRTDPGSNKRVMYTKHSPPLGMVHINYNEEKKYENYVSDIVDNHLDAFGELCWMEDDNDFQQKLFRLMTRVKPKNDDEAKLFREVYRLIVVTFIMSHTLTIAPETKYATLSRMHSYNGHNETYTSPRMTNRQLKYFFSRVQRSIQNALLNKLQQIFKSSKGCDKWLAAFITIVGMCMALEDEQKTIHLVQTTKSTTEGLDVRDAQNHADHANREIDTQMHFIQQIFRWKYNRKHNPLLNADHDWEKEVGFGDASSVNFVRQVAQLVKENTDYLQHRGAVSISSDNQTKYTARIVGKFLMSFWMPQ